MARLLFLASGEGTNFEAIVSAIQRDEIPGAEAVGLISNRGDAKVLDRAARLGVPAVVVDEKHFRTGHGRFDRDGYEEILLEQIRAFEPDWICLVGYLRVLGREIVRTYTDRILNIHPSLLPAFKGLHAQKQALDAGVSETGCTVHLVTEELDAGPTIVQLRVPVEPGDTIDSLSGRIRVAEHRAYVQALRSLLLH